MVVGVVTTKDIVSHPLVLIAEQGVRGYLQLLRHALSFKKYRFLDLLSAAGA